ncbi:hypothetical protein [Streptomyces sp. BRA346]|uniref:hypothetical protein n=1 Tax=Streptomyces sp. BRA346 TaxID=2878199 RepID=UPI004063F8A4
MQTAASRLIFAMDRDGRLPFGVAMAKVSPKSGTPVLPASSPARRWGFVVNLVAVLYGVAMTVNLAWPRAAIYGSDHWYFQWGAIVFTAVITAVGGLVYLRYRRHGRTSAAL